MGAVLVCAQRLVDSESGRVERRRKMKLAETGVQKIVVRFG